MQHLPPVNNRSFPGTILRFKGGSQDERIGYSDMVNDHNWERVRSQRYPHTRRLLGEGSNSAKHSQWLYLRVIRDILGDVTDDLIYRHPDGSTIITTTRLPEILKVWAQRIIALSFDASQIELQRVETALQNTASILTAHDERVDHDIQSSSTEWTLGAWCMIEALNQARLSVFSTCTPLENHRGLDYPTGVKALEETMVRRGWCPNQIKMCRTTFGISSLYYASLLLRPFQRRHLTCSQNDCLAYSVICRSQVTKHPSETCNCEDLVAPKELTRSLIQAELIPLVLLNRAADHTMTMSIVPYQAGQTFIAISHVWSHGLGNSDGNSLRRCQIERLFEFVTPLVDPPFLFWLDTFCVPREPYPLRRRAIAGIRRVYEMASKVLVLDEELLATSLSGMSYEEILMRINLSGWMRRLWTLHEQIRASQIYFQFTDGVYRQKELIENFENDVKAHKEAGVPFYKVIPARGISIWIKISRLKSGGDKRNAFVELWSLLRWRHLSWPEDETICMGNILGLSPQVVDQLLQTPHELRMLRFLNLFTHYPAALLFLQTEKLPYSGRRWAPVSWLHCVQHLDELLDIRVLDEFLGFRVKRGLIISCSSITINSSSCKDFDSSWSSVLFVSSMKAWFTVASHQSNRLYKVCSKHTWPGQLAICLERSLPSESVRAVLVATKGTEGLGHREITYARFLLNLRLQKIPAPLATLQIKSERNKGEEASPIIVSGNYMESRYWCIG